MGNRSFDRVDPRLTAAVPKILAAMEALGFPMMVTDTIRTDAEQQALYAQGRTTPGAIVTKADGVKKKSHHQPHADGLCHAVDCCFVIDGKPSWDLRLPWQAYGVLAETLGCRWGGRWDKADLPHIEVL